MCYLLAKFDLNLDNPNVEISTPSMKILPSAASTRRNNANIRLDLPAREKHQVSGQEGQTEETTKNTISCKFTLCVKFNEEKS